MGSDRARVTYDPKQQYRSVVMQQGRVTLEADWNEASQIASEELRRETLDFVGPCGTPDNGYEILLSSSPSNAPYDFSILPGTMYVGGVRAHLLETVDYNSQTDWLDNGPEDPLWVSLSSLPGSPPISDEFVYLYLREQEVSAVEDQDLKDIALGGPDTAQRTRLLQRFVRVACGGSDCASGLTAAETQWATLGLTFDSDTMRLKSSSTLEVSFLNPAQNQTPCQPQASGGYVDPDNQLIRVQIAGIDPASNNPQLIWGFDDASFLYRVDLDSGNNRLVFQSVPVDASHQPVKNQIVELLRTAAILPNGQYVASATGVVLQLDKNYDPDQQSVAIPSGVTLPLDYTEYNQSPPVEAGQLFLRVWQEMIPAAQPGTAYPLGDTGVQVTLGLQSPASEFHIGDYWMFAVRPATPQTVYPERYENAPQPPDGPRLWACPLGVIAWNGEVGTVVSDCRNEFCNLVDACRRSEGCCTITLNPQDVAQGNTLQQIINQVSTETMQVQAANAGTDGNNISVQISNLDLSASPPTFDLTVFENVLYTALNMGTVEGVVGDDESVPADELAHILTGSVGVQLTPLAQTVFFTNGSAGANAQANLLDANQNLLFTLAARTVGVDGNLTQVAISNVDSTQTPPTFDLTVTWQKTVSAVTMASLFPAIQNSFAYEIQAFQPATVPAFPAEGVTQLSGGVAGNWATGTNAIPASAYIFGNPTNICLRPGTYSLQSPLTLGVAQSNVTIEACNGATIAATADAEGTFQEFVTGMMHLNGASNVTLKGLTFAMPAITVPIPVLAGLPPDQLGDPTLNALGFSLGLVISGCEGITIEDCQFSFPAAQLDLLLIAIGISASGDCSYITLKGNSFQGPAPLRSVNTVGTGNSAVTLSLGYVQADALQSLTLDQTGTVTGGNLIPSSLDNIIMTGNSFENLSAAVFILTAVGAARFDSNIMRSCIIGFTIIPLLASYGTLTAATQDARYQILNNPTFQRMSSLAVSYPRPASVAPRRLISVVAKVAPVKPFPTGSRITAPALVQIPLPAVTPAPAPGTPTAATPAAPTAPAAVPAAGVPAVPARAALPTQLSKLTLSTPFVSKVAQYFYTVGSAATVGSTPSGSAPVYEEIVSLELNFSVQFNHNDVYAFGPSGPGLWALAVFDISALIQLLLSPPAPPIQNVGFLTITGNTFRNDWRGIGEIVKDPRSFTVCAMARVCAVTGNLIVNQAADSGSLIITLPASDPITTPYAAIAGNVLYGRPILPQHLPVVSPPLPDWTTYNAWLS
ncbi:MAG TPA: DUF6519 domain-containing protein [Terriglobales bacterium]|jgi:hypothetical protein|nr:DUF6519 domain-containing protein [Terriglobales bacterium]